FASGLLTLKSSSTSALAFDWLQHLQGQVSLVGAEFDLEGRHTIGAHDHVLRQFHRDHVARLHVRDVAYLQLATRYGGGQRYADIEDVFTQSLDPALVLIVDIGLEAGIEHLADRLDHRVRHGDVQVAAATIQFDMEGGHHYHFTGTDDVGQCRVDLGV